MEKLRTAEIHWMSAAIRFRNYCLPVCSLQM